MEVPPLTATTAPATTAPELPAAPAPFVAPPATAEPTEPALPELPPFQIPAQTTQPAAELAEPGAGAAPAETPATVEPVEEIPSFVMPEQASAGEAEAPATTSVIEQTVAVQPAPADGKTDEPFETVRVFYGTDRQPILVHQDSLLKRAIRFAPAIILILLSAIGIGVVITARKVTWMIGTTLLLVLSVLATWHSVRETIALANLAALEEPQYSAERSYRGQTERGICEVSIPKSHRAGELEGPSILRLEVQEDPRKHITLRKTTRLNDDVFYEQLRAQVASSPERELLVFVHGFNVTFEDAARRTGQMAKDLKLQGAPVFFSWPADKYFLLTYGKDETNVAWATPHLKEFLLELVAETDAKAINLVAHSMGSRALTTALREIDLQFREDARKFNQVVLAAPDIDADDFRDNIAPSIQRTARQVTLYASSNDIALSASRFFHRNARAGDTSRGLVIVAGMHTIDVSAIDGGPWGHSYYGASDPVLRDLHLLLGSLPPERRTWLKPSELDGQTYWAFRPLGTAAAPAMVTPR
jgi:esterase/lipase superfamily enzyme